MKGEIFIKLINALEIGNDCGLTTIGEALLNMRLHAMNIFNYQEETEELTEMYTEFKDSGFTEDDLIDVCILKLQSK